MCDGEYYSVMIINEEQNHVSVQGDEIHTRVTPERTSSKEIRLCPSLRSSYRSVMCFLT